MVWSSVTKLCPERQARYCLLSFRRLLFWRFAGSLGGLLVLYVTLKGQNLPHIDRAMEVPLLPLTRRALGTSTLVIGLPHRSLGPSSSGLGPSGAVLALRHVDGGLQTVVQPLSLAGNGVGQVCGPFFPMTGVAERPSSCSQYLIQHSVAYLQVESVTSLQVTDLHQTIVVMLDSRGVLHFFSTPLPQPILPVPVALEKGPQSRAKAQMQAMVPAAVQKAAFSRDPFSLLAIQWGRALGSQRQLSRVAGDERNGFCSSSVQARPCHAMPMSQNPAVSLATPRRFHLPWFLLPQDLLGLLRMWPMPGTRNKESCGVRRRMQFSLLISLRTRSW